MEVKQLSLDEIKTYGYCPMQWHLRYVVKLPWFYTSPESLFSKMSRWAVRSYFLSQQTNMGARKAADSAVKVMDDCKVLMERYYPNHLATIYSLYREGLLALLALPHHFGRQKDTLVAAPMPYEMSVKEGGKATVVKGWVDALFIRDDRTKLKTIIPVTVINNKDPAEHLNRWYELSYGFAQYAIRRGLGQHYSIPVRHMRYPIIAREPTVPNTSHFTSGFKKIVIQVRNAMDSGYILPTTKSSKCSHCPYEEVCSVSLIGKKDFSDQLQSVELRSKKYPTPGEIL